MEGRLIQQSDLKRERKQDYSNYFTHSAVDKLVLNIVSCGVW